MRRAVAASIMIASAAFAVSACQLISGLDNLHEDTTSAGGASSSSSSSTGTASSTGSVMATCPLVDMVGASSGSACGMHPPPDCGASSCDGTCCTNVGTGGFCEKDCVGASCTKPISCSNGGAGGDCLINCTGDADCKGMMGMPPPTIVCPMNQSVCHVVCDGGSGMLHPCEGAIIKCGDGPCIVECKNGGCSPDTKIECGANACHVSCVMVTSPTMDVGSSCDPEATGCTGLTTAASSTASASSSGAGG